MSTTDSEEASDGVDCIIDDCSYSAPTPESVQTHLALDHEIDHLDPIDDAEEARDRVQCLETGCTERYEDWDAMVVHLGMEHDVVPHLIDEIHRLADELGRTPEAVDMREQGRFSAGVYDTHFGTFNNALEELGYEPRHHSTVAYSDDYLLEVLRRLADQFKSDRVSSLVRRTAISTDVYRNHFDTLHSAADEADIDYDSSSWPLEGEDHPNWKEYTAPGYYGPNWQRIRERVLCRDGHNCACCRRDQTADESLHVHHIEPVTSFSNSEGRIRADQANRISNLVTLCPSCHQSLEGNWSSCTADQFKSRLLQDVARSVSPLRSLGP